MTFKILIVEDNHSFIDTLKVMLRDLPLDFSHAYRYNDALAILAKQGIFYNRQENAGETAETKEPPSKRKVAATQESPINENGIFLIIVEQNTETSMKGTDFIAHAIRKFPSLSESNFILLTHRLDAVPTRNYGFPVIEKPLRPMQIREAVLAKIKQAQEITEIQARTTDKPSGTETAEARPKAPRKGLRSLLKIKRSTEQNAEIGLSSDSDNKAKPVNKSRAAKPRAKGSGSSKKRKTK
jgi:CheY-like chemotaxis protein